MTENVRELENESLWKAPELCAKADEAIAGVICNHQAEACEWEGARSLLAVDGGIKRQAGLSDITPPLRLPTSANTLRRCAKLLRLVDLFGSRRSASTPTSHSFKNKQYPPQT